MTNEELYESVTKYEATIEEVRKQLKHLRNETNDIRVDMKNDFEECGLGEQGLEQAPEFNEYVDKVAIGFDDLISSLNGLDDSIKELKNGILN